VSETSGYAAGPQGGQQPADQAPGYLPPQPQGYAPYGYPYPAPYPAAPPQAPRNGHALTAMILGIVGLCTSIFYIGGVIGIIGLVFAIIAIRAINRTGQQGKGMAIAGLVTAILAIIINAIEIVLIVWVVHTVSNCNQYEPNTTQYNQCVRTGILGN
jgi:hypothetical protein